MTKSTQIAAIIDELRREFGFDPHDQLHELTSTSKTAKRDCKRVFEALLEHRDSDATSAVIEEVPLDERISRGESCGIRSLAHAALAQLCPALAR